MRLNVCVDCGLLLEYTGLAHGEFSPWGTLYLL